jgi:hypothetical protein
LLADASGLPERRPKASSGADESASPMTEAISPEGQIGNCSSRRKLRLAAKFGSRARHPRFGLLRGAPISGFQFLLHLFPARGVQAVPFTAQFGCAMRRPARFSVSEPSVLTDAPCPCNCPDRRAMSLYLLRLVHSALSPSS